MLIPLRVNLAYQMVPAPHREVALKWSVALLERAFFWDGTFHLHSEKGKPHWWSGTKVDVVEVSAAQLVDFPYTQVFTSKGAHWGLAVVLSFLAWPLGFLARRRWGKVVRGVRSRRLLKGRFSFLAGPLRAFLARLLVFNVAALRRP